MEEAKGEGGRCNCPTVSMCVTAISISHGSCEISDYTSQHKKHDFLFPASPVPAS